MKLRILVAVIFVLISLSWGDEGNSSDLEAVEPAAKVVNTGVTNGDQLYNSIHDGSRVKRTPKKKGGKGGGGGGGWGGGRGGGGGWGGGSGEGWGGGGGCGCNSCGCGGGGGGGGHGGGWGWKR